MCSYDASREAAKCMCHASAITAQQKRRGGSTCQQHRTEGRVCAPMTAQPSSLARERVRGMEWQAWMGRCSSAPALALLTTGDSGAALRPQHSTPAAPRKYAARIAAPRFCCAPTQPAVSTDVGGALVLSIMQAKRYQVSDRAQGLQLSAWTATQTSIEIAVCFAMHSNCFNAHSRHKIRQTAKAVSLGLRSHRAQATQVAVLVMRVRPWLPPQTPPAARSPAASSLAPDPGHPVPIEHGRRAACKVHAARMSTSILRSNEQLVYEAKV